MDQLKLVGYIGQRVILEFTDGECVEARILGVDVDPHEDLMFDLIRVIRSGPTTAYDGSSVYQAELASIRRVDLVAADE